MTILKVLPSKGSGYFEGSGYFRGSGYFDSKVVKMLPSERSLTRTCAFVVSDDRPVLDDRPVRVLFEKYPMTAKTVKNGQGLVLPSTLYSYSTQP